MLRQCKKEQMPKGNWPYRPPPAALKYPVYPAVFGGALLRLRTGPGRCWLFLIPSRAVRVPVPVRPPEVRVPPGRAPALRVVYVPAVRAPDAAVLRVPVVRAPDVAPLRVPTVRLPDVALRGPAARLPDVAALLVPAVRVPGAAALRVPALCVRPADVPV